jgi:ribose-phosphate pyrophosphokinase
MSFDIYVDKGVIPVTITRFPAGESCIRLTTPGYTNQVLNAKITYRFDGNGSLFDLALVVDALRRAYPAGLKLSLDMPYLPYARQDRVCNEGESLSVKVVADFINSLQFDKVFCHDIHSEVGAALLNNLVHIKQGGCAHKLPSFLSTETAALVSPDAGAEKKVFDVAKKLGYNNVIRASKVRNVATGKIEATKIIDSLHAYGERVADSFLIVDDICDGGRTFIELAKAVRSNEAYDGQPVYLYVTHGIFSAGLDVFNGYIDKIFVNNLMNPALEGHPMIQII